MTKHRILVVEDETIVAMDIQQMLEKLGYDVSAVVSSGEESLRKASLLKLDLVLMDIRLKGKIDGLKAAQHLKKRFNLPVIYLTAYGDEDTKKKTRKIKHFGFIHKPFEEKELISTIEKALSQSNN